MRKTVIAALLCSGSLIVLGCSEMPGHEHENVKSTYVGVASMDQDQVAQLLTKQGYTDITNLHKNGPDWVGAASKDGQMVNFDIDKDGTIHTK
ncbi:MAG: hypothetical protein JO184_03460 [Gammaproteobacteria bacterium]|nr:hypothetical protein [Gammaproteobacteria bacterium]MBV8405582.1 hypothetical protein [Gammaproteobacteria bacterium]